MSNIHKIGFIVIIGILVAGLVNAAIGTYWKTVDDIIPRVDETRSIGSSTKELLKLWTKNLSVSGLGGFGDTTPEAVLETTTNSGASAYFMVSSTESGDGDYFIVDSSGNVGIGNSTPTERLDLGSGNFITTGTASINSVVIPDIFDDMAEPTGFENRTDSALSWDDATYTFTITGTNFGVYFNGVKVLKNTESIQIGDTTGAHWIYYDKTTQVLSESTTSPTFDNPFIATVYWNTTTNKGILGEERHTITMDYHTHTLLHFTVGTRYESGLTGTFGNTTFSITSGVIDDEDIAHQIGAETTCNVLYKNGTADFEWDANQTIYYKEVGGVLQYNNGNALANVGVNQYMAMWIFATNDTTKPIVALMGQRVDNILANARDNNKYENLTLGTLPFQEMKILYRVILRNQAGTTTWIENQDLRSVSNLPGGTFLATLHDTLTNLDWNSSGHNDTDFNVDYNGDGRIGIGDISPDAILEVTTNSTTIGTDYFYISTDESSDGDIFKVDSSGNLTAGGTLQADGGIAIGNTPVADTLLIETSDTDDPTLSWKTTNTANQINLFLNEDATDSHDELVLEGQTASVDTMLTVLAKDGEFARVLLYSGTNRSFIQHDSGDDLTIRNDTADADIIWSVNDSDGDSTTTITFDASTNNFIFNNNTKLTMGSGQLVTTGTAGIGVTDPDVQLEVLDTGTQLKLSYDAVNYATFTTQSDGDLTLDSNKGSYTFDLGDALILTTGTLDTGVATVDGIDLQDNQKILVGTGDDGEIYTDINNHLNIKNVTSDADLILGVNDGGTPVTITWNANIDELEHSRGTFNFSNDNIDTTGDIDCSDLIVGSTLTWEVVANGSVIVDERSASLVFFKDGSIEGQHMILELFPDEGEGDTLGALSIFGLGDYTNLGNYEAFQILEHTDGDSYIRTLAGGDGVINNIKLMVDTTNVAIELDSDGHITALPTYTNTVNSNNKDLEMDDSGEIGAKASSGRYKTNIRDLEGSERIYDLRPVRYDSLDGKSVNDMGFIAEEVEMVFPDVVRYEVLPITERFFDEGIPPNGEWTNRVIGYERTDIVDSVNTKELIPSMIAEMQKLREELDALKESCK